MASDLLFLSFRLQFLDWLHQVSNSLQEFGTIFQNFVPAKEEFFSWCTSSFDANLQEKQAKSPYNSRELWRLMTQVLDPDVGEVVYDPSCGTGGFLVEARSYLKAKCRTAEEREFVDNHSFFGHEQDSVRLRLAKVNCFINGFEFSQARSTGFDVVLGNPPYTTQSAEPADILHQIWRNFQYLKEEGKTALLFPTDLFTPELREVCGVTAKILHQNPVCIKNQDDEFLLLVLQKRSDRDVVEAYFERAEAELKSPLIQSRSTSEYHVKNLSFQKLIFELRCHQRKGTEFQRWLEKILYEYDDSFIPVKPSGQEGDWKCDGFSEATGTVYQAYAPYKLKGRKAAEKIEEDFEGAKEKWGKKMKRWVFVWNEFEGLPPQVLYALQEIKDKNPDIKTEIWGSPKLWTQVFLNLSEEKREELLEFKLL